MFALVAPATWPAAETSADAPADPLTDLAVDIVPEGGAGTGLVGAAPSAVVSRIGADAWHAAGLTGQGVTIGVIDFLDVAKYWTSALGPAPTVADVFCRALGADCSATFFDGVDQGGENHGAAVAGAIRTVAPGARIVYGRATTLADYRAVIDWFATQGVTIVNRSLGSRYDGPGDGRGGLDEVAEYAVSRGMLWVNSGGNNGDRKYYRSPVTVTGGWVDFGGTRYLEFNGAAQLAGVRWANDWDVPAAERSDYDVYLYRAPAGRPAEGVEVARSALRQTAGAVPLETIAGNYSPAAGERLYLAVEYRGGDTRGDVLEILDYGDGFTSGTTVAGSAAVPVVDSRSAGVVSVGAIDPPSLGHVASYSAQGPTNDGRVVPTLTAPTGYANAVWGDFSGTSAAAAVTSGAAALLAGAGVASEPATLAAALKAAAVDHGAPGPDNAFGAGELRLPAPKLSPLAAAGVASRYVPLTPTRLLDTRSSGGALAGGETRTVVVAGRAGVPAEGVTAVAVNAVSVDAGGPGYLQLLPTGQAAAGSYSNINTDAAAQTRANFAIVPLGNGGSIGVHASGSTHVVLDVLGYFTALGDSATAGRFVELATPQRALDTRVGEGAAPMQAGSRRSVPMPAGIDPAQVTALVVTVTGTGVTQPGWVQAYPTGSTGLVGTTSTLNLAAGETVANLAIVPVGTAGSTTGISVASQFAAGGQADVVVDVVGYITSGAAPASSSGRFVAVAPARAFDSRHTGGALGDHAGVDVAGPAVPASASAVVWNTAIVAATRAGYARVWAAGAPEPSTSALNWSRPGETRAVAAISRVTGGSSRFLVDDGPANEPTPVGHLIADVFGYFT
ncbi:MAG TPA: S8 family serine peptidase [Ilumatobacter sp.]|nr:S8 family serine peptidase [Ilumatobacter sp.]